MPRTTEERVMRRSFPTVQQPALPSSHERSMSAGTGSGSGSRPFSVSTQSSPVFIDDDVLYPGKVEPEADAARLSTAVASRQLFLASPGQSNSIVDSAWHAAPQTTHGLKPSESSDNARAATNVTAAFGKPKRASSRLRYDDIIAVQVTSGAPRADFLESMVEMADAMGLDPRRGAADVAALHELLLCYIAVNESNALSDIFGSYADLLRLFGGDAAADGEGRDTDVQRQRRTGA